MNALTRRRVITLGQKINNFFQIWRAIRKINKEINMAMRYSVSQTTSLIRFDSYITREQCGKIVKYFTKRGYSVAHDYDITYRNLAELTLTISWEKLDD